MRITYWKPSKSLAGRVTCNRQESTECTVYFQNGRHENSFTMKRDPEWPHRYPVCPGTLDDLFHSGMHAGMVKKARDIRAVLGVKQ